MRPPKGFETNVRHAGKGNAWVLSRGLPKTSSRALTKLGKRELDKNEGTGRFGKFMLAPPALPPLGMCDPDGVTVCVG